MYLCILTYGFIGVMNLKQKKTGKEFFELGLPIEIEREMQSNFISLNFILGP